METVFSRTASMTFQLISAVSRPAFRRVTCVVATLVSGFVLLSGNLVTRKVESRPAVAIHAAGRGLPYLNLQDGRELSVSYIGDSRSASALQNGTTRSRALAVADLDGDAAPDLVAGYTNGASGIVTIQKGNPEGFAPKDDSVFVRMQQGYNPDSLLPTVETFPVSSPVDFLQLGDFNQDGRKDVLVATRDGNLLLLPGDGQGGLGAEEQIKIPGTVTALTTGEFRAADGRADVAVAINGEGGPEVLVFDGAAGGFDSEPFRYPLAGRSIGLEFGELDSDPFMDLAAVVGSEVEIVHGWGRKVAKQANMQVERVQLGFAPQSIAVDNFTWDREGTREIALLAEDGAVHLLENSRSDKRPLTASDVAARAAMRGNVTNKNVDVEVVQGWKNAGSGKWREINQLSLNARTKNAAATQALLVHGKISSGQTNALMVVNEAQQALQVVHQARGNNTSAQDVLTGDLSTTTLEATDTPTAVVALPKKLNGVRDLVMLQDSRPTPVNISIEPLATFGVNTTSDHAPDGACNASPDCTFREAVIAANASAGPDTINLPAGTYTLTIIGNTNSSGAGEGFTGNPAIGDVDFRDNPDPNQNPGNGDATTVAGAGSGTTFIVQSTANDRVMEPNPNGDLNFDWTISGVTIAGGRDTGGSLTGGGGGILSGSKDNLTTVTNCVWANNRATGSGGSGGGGISNQGGTVVVTNTVFGGAVTTAACPSQTATNCGNLTGSSGGGIGFSPGDPFGRTPSAGTLTIQTTSSFQNNTAGTGAAGGGGGADLYTHNLGTGSVAISGTTFTSNVAIAGGFGGGIFVESIATTISATSFTTNSAGVRGGGIQVAGGSLLLDGTSPSITFTGNTATTAGSSISTSSAVNLSGTNTTIGGDLEITTNGSWTNNVGSTMSPNNLIIIGTGNFTANNSTTNVSGNFQFQSGTFNAGTGLFNFNGTGTQTINNSVAITFNNLTDSNVNQQLTINNNVAVNGTLNMNGAATTLNPLAGTVVSGTGTLNGSGTVRVTRTAATADFLSQYTITNKTLTNLLVDYVGAAAQVLSSITYSGGLRINNASGVTSAAGTATVDGVLTLTAGALNVNTSTLVINNGTSVAAGSITSAATGTVNYNQGTAGQNVLAFNYGNLTFSNQNKVLASTGTIGIAGVFTPGTAVGHTITGSTINFNGSGAQTIPAFNYNNLTSSNAGARTLANAGTIGVAGAFTPGGNTYTITGSTIDYNGGGAQTISAFNYNNLTSSNSGARTLINGGTIGIAGVFTPGGNAYTITGNTINFNGAGAQNIPAFNYNNLTSSNAGARTLPNGGTVGIAGAFTPGGNSYTITGSTIDFNGAGAQTIPAFNYNNLTSSNAGARTLANAGTIGIAAVFTPGTNTYTITGSTIDFNGAGAQTIPAFNYNNLTSSNAGARTLANSGNIGIAGVFTPGGNAYTITGSTVVFNGTSAQTLPAGFTTYNNLTLNNSAGVSGFAGLTVQGLLRVQAGTFTSSSIYNNVQIDAGATLAGTNATTINVSGTWTNNGTFTANNDTVNFNGSGAQVIGGSSVTTFQNLTIANAGSGVSLGQNATVNGVLTLTNDLTTGANILTQPGTGTSAGAGDVVGNVKRTGFITGGANTLSFGNLNNQITINSGTVPTDITINLVKAAPSGGIAFPTAVLRTYTVTPTGGSGISATMRLRYIDTELNGNTEAGLALWRHDGAAWSRQGATTADTTNNWVQLSGISQFSPWTLSSAKNDTTTTITADSPDPSQVGQAVPINFSVVSNVSGAPAVTGNVTITVNDASGDTCTGALGGGGTGSCNLTLTTVGAKTLTATYNADSNFNGSSDTEPHQVVQGTVVINDGSVSEPTSGTTTMLFTVTLSAPALGGESVDFATADQVAGPGHAVAGSCGTVGVDYQANSGTLAFALGQQVKTISVTVCSDTDNSEPDETFLVNLTNPQGGVIITDNQAVGTIKTANAAGTFLISELRTSGPAGPGDDFVEFYNNSNSPLTVAATDASAGYGVYKIGADCDAIPVLVGTIPNGTVIPARGHYLMVGSAYSLANYGGSGAAAGNLTLTTDIESDRNVAVFSTANALNISSANRLDAVGFGTNIASVCALMREGNTLQPLSGSALEYSFFRSMKPASGGNPQDTNDNLADFLFADTNATVTPAGQRLGAPGPERAPDPTNGSPIRRDNSGILVALLDGTVSSTVGPNRVRNFASILPNYPNGSLEVRRRVQNNTGGSVTRLRFRIVEMTTGPTPPVGTADLRAITSAAATVSVNDPATCAPGAPPCSVTAQVTTLETPPAQANGGGYNATLSVGTITLGTPLANGASALVNLQLGVKQGGTFRFLIIVEALP